MFFGESTQKVSKLKSGPERSLRERQSPAGTRMKKGVSYF